MWIILGVSTGQTRKYMYVKSAYGTAFNAIFFGFLGGHEFIDFTL